MTKKFYFEISTDLNNVFKPRITKKKKVILKKCPVPFKDAFLMVTALELTLKVKLT